MTQGPDEREYTVESVTYCIMYKISADKFRSLVEDYAHPRFQANILNVADERLAELNKQREDTV